MLVSMRKILLISFLALLISSCNYNSSVVFKLPSDYPFAVDSVSVPVDYKIVPYDKLIVRVLVNNGSRLVDISAGITNTELNSSVSGNASIANSATTVMNELKVDKDGFVRLPLVGLVGLKGLTIAEAEKLIEDRFAKSYIDPFVTVTVTNRRVTVFPGMGGTGQVVSLTNENTSVLEVLALNGGINLKGKSKRVRLVRKVDNQFKVYSIDLSNESGFASGQMIVHANDIIYVDQVKSLTTNFASEFGTIIGLLTSVVLLYDIISRNQ